MRKPRSWKDIIRPGAVQIVGFGEDRLPESVGRIAALGGLFDEEDQLGRSTGEDPPNLGRAAALFL